MLKLIQGVLRHELLSKKYGTTMRRILHINYILNHHLNNFCFECFCVDCKYLFANTSRKCHLGCSYCRLFCAWNSSQVCDLLPESRISVAAAVA